MDNVAARSFDLQPAGPPDRSRAARIGVAVLVVAMAAGLVGVIAARRPAHEDHTGYATGRPLAELVPSGQLGVVVARDDGSVVLRVLPGGHVPDGPPGTAAAAPEVDGRLLFTAPDGHDLLDLAVDPGGEHVLVTTAPSGSCDPRLQRIDVVSGAVEELGAGYAPAATGVVTTWLQPAPGAACTVGAPPLSRRSGLTPTTLVVDGPGGRRTVPAPAPAPAPVSVPLHPVVPSPDGAVLAVVGGGRASLVPTTAVLPDVGQGRWPDVTDRATVAADAVAWADDALLLAARPGVVELHLVEVVGDGAAAAPQHAEASADEAVSAVDARWGGPQHVDDDPGVEAAVVVTVHGALRVVPAAGGGADLEQGVVDAALVHPARTRPPRPSDTLVDGTVPGTSAPQPASTVPPVVERRRRAPMGGNRNVLGWAGLLEGEPDGFFVAIDGACSGKVQGDRYATRTMGSDAGSGCAGIDNPEFRTGGYTFVVEVPDGHGALDLVMADPGGPGAPPHVSPDDGVVYRELRRCQACPPPTTTVVVRDPGGAELARHVVAPKDASSSLRRANEDRLTLATIAAAAPPGDYRIEVSVDAASDGSNAFGLGAFAAGTTTACEVASDATCARIYAADGLSIGLVGATTQRGEARVPLAALDEGSAVLVVELWDPGEGAQSLEVLRPDGTPATFTWAVVGGGAAGGPTDELAIVGMEHNGKLVRLDVSLDGGAVAGQWTVRYQSAQSGPVTDRTTWDVFLER